MRWWAQVLSLAVAVAGANAWACEHHDDPQASVRPANDPGLLGDACRFSTATLLELVVRRGDPWTVAGHLRAAPTPEALGVAAPYVVGPQEVRVIANELLDALKPEVEAGRPVRVEGRVMEAHGVRYFVVTQILHAQA